MDTRITRKWVANKTSVSSVLHAALKQNLNEMAFLLKLKLIELEKLIFTKEEADNNNAIQYRDFQKLQAFKVVIDQLVLDKSPPLLSQLFTAFINVKNNLFMTDDLGKKFSETYLLISQLSSSICTKQESVDNKSSYELNAFFSALSTNDTPKNSNKWTPPTSRKRTRVDDGFNDKCTKKHRSPR